MSEEFEKEEIILPEIARAGSFELVSVFPVGTIFQYTGRNPEKMSGKIYEKIIFNKHEYARPVELKDNEWHGVNNQQAIPITEFKRPGEN